MKYSIEAKIVRLKKIPFSRTVDLEPYGFIFTPGLLIHIQYGDTDSGGKHSQIKKNKKNKEILIIAFLLKM